ncbi:MAG: SHOCT domain-containing protein [Candidatus Micrarchaeota archaeon]
MKPLVFALLIAGVMFATMGQDELREASQLIDSNVSCDKLTDTQLELIGDYYMEQMHPGQAHERMDQMMGGEGSESLKNVHVQMALVLYCGQTNTSVTYGGMMDMMPFIYRSGFGGGMMWSPYGGMMGYGDMMGYYSWGWIVSLVFWILLFVAIVLLVYWLYRSIRGGGAALSALEILKQRYAKGEITKKQYEEMREELE